MEIIDHERKARMEGTYDFTTEIEKLREPLFEFKEGDSWYLNAYVNASSGDWSYMEGYRRAGDLLVEWVAEHGEDQDLLVFPIVFAYRQYLELRLKSLGDLNAALCHQPMPSDKSHNLMHTWKRVRPGIESMNDPYVNSYLDDIERRLREFSALDEASYAFRYSLDTHDQPSIPDVTYINLKQVGEVIRGIAHILDSCYDCLDASYQEMASWERDYGS